MATQKPIIVVAGLDDEKRPHAAKFLQSEEAPAIKAAHLMGFQIGMAETPKALSLARALTKGRIFATGRALVPYVKQEIYDEMLSAIAFETPNIAIVESDDPLAIGRVVLCEEGPKQGWWEALIIERDDEHDRLTLRWRDWPQMKRFSRTRGEIAIIGVAQPPESAR